MKLIETFKSPNFNKRKSNQKLRYIILHYTAMTSFQEALEHMCEETNKVSAHFLVSKKGEVFHLVNLENSAWHAGQSYWGGLKNLNSNSIGIEIDNSGHHNYNEDYPHVQIKSLCELIRKLAVKFDILPENVLGHSDIAPFRKIDPGEKFPWKELNKKKLSYSPMINLNIGDVESKKNETNYKYEKNKEILIKLGLIGYDIRNVKVEDDKFKLLIQAYQRHHRQTNVLGEIDSETIRLIKQHFIKKC